MFRQLRIVSLFGFVIVSLAALVLTGYSYRVQQQTLIEHGERGNLRVAAVLQEGFSAALDELQSRRDQDAVHAYLDDALQRALLGRSVAEIAFYDPQGTPLYPARSSLIDERNKPMLAKLSGSHSSLRELTTDEGVAYRVRTLMPITLQGGGRLVLLLEEDISALYLAVEANRWRQGAFSLAILLLLYLLLYMALRYATEQLRANHLKLQRSLEELHCAREALEQRVDERTKVLAQEVEERRNAERLLREQEAYLSATMENVFNAIICIDAHGYVRSFNKTAETMFGYSADQILGKKVNCLMPDEHRGRHDHYLEAYLRTGKRNVIGCPRELSARRQDGSYFPMELAVTETELANQTLFIGTIRDLSQQKQAERDLNEARQKYYHQEKMAAIGSLAAGLVHEIGNPTAAISGLLDALIEDDSLSPELLRENLELIREQVMRIIQITRDVSEFSTPQGQEAQLLDLNNLIGRTVRLMRHDRRSRDVIITLDLNNQIPAVQANGDHLIQVLMNLLVNALDAIEISNRSDGLITVRSGLDSQEVWFEVEDNGSGMSSEVLQHAREAFYTTKAVGKGTGLGLSLCDSLLSAQQGALEIYSAEGQGSRVRARLPLGVEVAA